MIFILHWKNWPVSHLFLRLASWIQNVEKLGLSHEKKWGRIKREHQEGKNTQVSSDTWVQTLDLPISSLNLSLSYTVGVIMTLQDLYVDKSYGIPLAQCPGRERLGHGHFWLNLAWEVICQGHSRSCPRLQQAPVFPVTFLKQAPKPGLSSTLLLKPSTTPTASQGSSRPLQNQLYRQVFTPVLSLSCRPSKMILWDLFSF